MVSYGFIVSLHNDTIFLRVFCSMGPAKDRYLHYDKSRGYYSVRGITGVLVIITNVAVYPEYFYAEVGYY